MPEVNISGVPINFPFEPYDVQKAYMTKVIECLQNETNGVLESPTGTGKTLSLLCSTLAWILTKKEQAKQFMQQTDHPLGLDDIKNTAESLVNSSSLKSSIEINNWGVPKVIYASRTHSQLTQAIHELKQSSYSFMKAVVLGSRDQLCIHPEVSKEINNSNKIQLCKIHVTNRSCSFHSRIESKKENPEFKLQNIMDIEDLVTIGRKLRMCPYYSSREVIPDADIVFMPYNYLLDPKARRANKVELNNTIVILDEAHNVEKMCEESASVKIKSSDIALAINDITQVMKSTSENNDLMDLSEEPKDFTLDDLASLKEIILGFEKVIDSIEVKSKFDGITYPGSYIFELFERANINFDNFNIIISLLDKIINFLTGASQKNAIFQNGIGLQVLSDFLSVTFAGKTEEKKEKTFKSFKVHIEIEEIKSKKSTQTKNDGWLNSSKTNLSSIKMEKIINYWCFNAGYGMEELLNKNVRTIILTSGTLAPLKPLIAELGIPVTVQLENPHIVNRSQVCVKVISYGPDKERLISNYENRDNPKYINSLGGTISNFSTVIPNGLLVFFPSYVVMNKCIDTWRASGVWSQINKKKTVFVEPQGKDAFTTTMSEFYEKIQDKNSNGACFMAVCRGKVSEGLDFADMNGRAVIITGLPFPPFKDPRIILKRQYLESNRTKENELLSGQDWYSLEGSRAVNQAIGRVIRHKNDYGAILFCDIRFQQPKQQAQLSSWIQGHLRRTIPNQNFGSILRELKQFFENAKKTLPGPKLRENIIVTPTTDNYNFPSVDIKRKAERLPDQSLIKLKNNFTEQEKIGIDLNWTAGNYSSSTSNNCTSINAMDFMSRLDGNVSTINFNECCSTKTNNDTETISYACTSQPSSSEHFVKRRKLKLVSNESPLYSIPSISLKEIDNDVSSKDMTRKEFLDLIKSSLVRENYVIFIEALMAYKKEETVDNFFTILLKIFGTTNSYHYILKGIRRYIKESHKSKFDYLLAEFLKS